MHIFLGLKKNTYTFEIRQNSKKFKQAFLNIENVLKLFCSSNHDLIYCNMIYHSNNSNNYLRQLIFFRQKIKKTKTHKKPKTKPHPTASMVETN